MYFLFCMICNDAVAAEITKIGTNDINNDNQIQQETPNITINYIPTDIFTFVEQSTNGDEFVKVTQHENNTVNFNVAVSDKLAIDQKENYPISIFKLSYDEFGNVTDRIDYPPEMFGMASSSFDCVDNDINFDFVWPKDWGPKDITNVYMKIGPNSSTYSATSNTIIVTGGSVGTPVTFDDIHAADLANGWGVVTQSGSCTSCYCFDAKIIIGSVGTPTYFADTSKNITFSDNSCIGNQSMISLIGTASLTFGELLNESEHITTSGVNIISDNTEQTSLITTQSTSNVNLYSSNFLAKYNSQLMAFCYDIFNCTFKEIVIIPGWDYLEFYNVYMDTTPIGILTAIPATYQADMVTITNTSQEALGYAYNGNTIYNVRLIDNALDIYIGYIATYAYLVNSYSDNWSVYIFSAASKGIYRQYTLDLLINDSYMFPISGGNVTITDCLDTVIYDGSLSNSGTIPTQNLSHTLYSYSGTTQATATTYNPYTLTITKDGYETYQSTINMDEKKELEISLVAIKDTSLYGVLSQYWGDSMLASGFILLLALFITIAAYYMRSLILQFVAACFWSGGALHIMIDPPWDDPIVGQFFAWPSMAFGIYLLFMLGIQMFGGRYNNNG